MERGTRLPGICAGNSKWEWRVQDRLPLCDPHAGSMPLTYLLPGGVERLSGAWGSDCVDHVGPLGLMAGRSVGGVEALLLFMTLLARFRFVT